MSRAEATLRRVTYRDYLAWSDGERWEIIHGRSLAMTPSPTVKHQRILLRLGQLLGEDVEARGCSLLIAPLDLVLDEENVVQPDLMVVCREEQILESHVEGAPTIIMEISSPSTALRDRREKRDLFEEFGVKEYILVLPVEELVEGYRLGEGGYGAPRIYNWDENLPLSSLGLTLPLWKVFSREPGEEGSPERKPAGAS